MAWRFKASKYKNAAFNFPKKEVIISELPVGGLSQSAGNHIKSSCVYVVFNTDLSAGSSLGYLPVIASGKQDRQNIPLIQAHSDFVTDFDFSPFDDYLLATGSQDNTIKVWLLPEADGSSENITSPVVTLPQQDKRIENVLWHSTADGVLAASIYKSIKVFDVKQSKEVYVLGGHNDVVQSMSWDGYGKLLVSSCKDKILRIFDPRTSTVVQEGPGCQNIRETRVVWLGNREQILTTGFDQSRNRTIRLHDARNIKTVLETKPYDSSTGVVMPLFDSDTGMLFLAGKGDTSIRYLEVNDKEPYLVENSIERIDQIKGIAMMPKRGVDVMQGEVTRIMILAQNCIIPTPVIIPRKSYREYHSDIYPDTSTGEPGVTCDQWISGNNNVLSLMSLEPGKRPDVACRRGAVFSTDKQSVVSNGVNNSSKESSPNTDQPVVSKPKSEIISSKLVTPILIDTSLTNQQVDSIKSPATVLANTNINNNSSINEATDSIEEEKPVKAKKTFTGVRQSKFRHVKGTLLHRGQHIENIRHQDRTVPGESDMFHANKVRCAVPIEGAGGILSVFELSNSGKQPNTDVPYIQNGSKVTDYVWDPFDDTRLVVCCDDAKIRVWRIPEGGLTETLMEPEMYLKGHTEKIYFARFHPMAKDLLVTSAYDMKVKFWDLSDGSEIMEITEHSDQVFCCAWSIDGKQLATVCKDGLIRFYDPRTSLQAIKTGEGPTGSRGARCGWVLGDKYFFTSGFNRSSTREIILYDVEDLKTLNSVTIDTAPSILVPFYDEDSRTLFLTGRGDRLIHIFEIAEDEPHLFQLSSCQPGNLHQALSFQSKNKCVVKDVEFAKAWRLTKTTIEPLSFTVPRVKTEYFQDDLFPNTKVTWEPCLSCSDWLAGQDGVQKTISLKPDNMKLLSDAPALAPKPKKYDSFNVQTYKTDDEKKEELLRAMTNKLQLHDEPLPQDLTEGVEEEEWDDY